jgi:hypothetical protein
MIRGWRNSTLSANSAKAIVARARYRPFNRSAGMAMITPSGAQIKMTKSKPQGSPFWPPTWEYIAAPKPAMAKLAKLTWPAQPVSGISDSMIRPRIMNVAPRPSQTSVRWPKCVPQNHGIQPLAHAATMKKITKAPSAASLGVVNRS